MSIETAVGGHLYRQNATGETVKQIQLGLKAIGYKLSGTGTFGPATNTAVRSFQRTAGLSIDGVVGGKTAKAIDLAVATPNKPGVISISPATTVPAAQIGRPLWFEAGMGLLGTHEGAGAKDNPVIIDWAKDLGGEIAVEYTHDSIPWCSLFACHVLSKVGLESPESLWALDWADPKKWPCVRLGAPAVGAFAPMVRNGGGHITMVAGKDQHGNIMGLGGNQRDAVTIEPFAISRLNKGYFWPASVPLPDKIGMSNLPIISSSGKVSSNEA